MNKKTNLLKVINFSVSVNVPLQIRNKLRNTCVQTENCSHKITGNVLLQSTIPTMAQVVSNPSHLKKLSKI